MNLRPCCYLLLLGLLALPIGCAREMAAAVEETDLVPLDRSGGMPPAAQPRAETEPAQEGEAQTRIVRALLETIDGLGEEVSIEERDQLRDMLMEADAELDDALGEGAMNAILEANNRHQGIDFRRARLRQRPQAQFCTEGSYGDPNSPELRHYRGYQEFGTPPAGE